MSYSATRFFDPLTYHIEQHFATGKPSYPVERTLLTSTILDHAMRSQQDEGAAGADESLRVQHQPPVTSGFFNGSFVDRPE